MTVETISNKDEQRMLEAVKEIKHGVDQGMSPTDSAIKVAEKYNMPQEHMRRVVEAHNVNATLCHFKEAAGDRKAEDFDIINPDSVIEPVYGIPTESPLKQAAAAWTPAGDMYAETIDFAAPGVATFSSGTVRHSMDSGEAVSTVLADYAKESSYVAVERAELDQQGERLVESIDKLAAHFTSIDSPDTAMLDDSVRDYVVERVPYLRRRGITANGAWEPAYKQACAACDDYIKQASKLTVLEGHLLRMGTVSEARIDAVKSSGFLNLMGAGAMGAVVGDKMDKGKAEKKIDVELEDPVFVGKRKGLKAQTMLSTLIADDEVLRHAAESDVVNAFNEIASLAPGVAEQPMLLRAYLRRSVESKGLDPFDIHELVKTDRDVRKSLWAEKGKDDNDNG